MLVQLMTQYQLRIWHQEDRLEDLMPHVRPIHRDQVLAICLFDKCPFCAHTMRRHQHWWECKLCRLRLLPEQKETPAETRLTPGPRENIQR